MIITEVTGSRKASASENSGCAQVGHAVCKREPRKSSASNPNGSSVNVSIQDPEIIHQPLLHGHYIALSNDTPLLARPVMIKGVWYILYTRQEWEAFIDGAKKGEFDLDEDGLLPPASEAVRAAG